MKKYLSLCLPMLLLLFATTSCTHDENVQGERSAQAIGIKINIDKGFAATRSSEIGDNAENLVEEVVILVYDSFSEELLEKFLVSASNLEETAYGYYCKIFPTITEKGVNTTYYVVANPTSVITNLAIGSTLADLLAFKYDLGGDVPVTPPFLMDGSSSITIPSGSAVHDYEVDLKRNVSKIRLKVKFDAQSGIVPQFNDAKVKVTNLFYQSYHIIQPLPPSGYERCMDYKYDWASLMEDQLTDCYSFECYIPTPPVENSTTGQYPVLWLQLPVEINGVLRTKNYYKIAIDPKLNSCEEACNVIFDIDLQLKGLGTENEDSELSSENAPKISVLPWSKGSDTNESTGVYIKSQTGGTVCLSNYPATFTVTAGGPNNNTVQYQWFVNGEQINGATSSTYNWVPDGTHKEGCLYCVASVGAEQAISEKIEIKKPVPNCFIMYGFKENTVEFPLEDALAMGRVAGSLTDADDVSQDSLVTLWRTSANVIVIPEIINNTTCKITTRPSLGDGCNENAVVALKVNGKIVWSWHLWILGDARNPEDGVTAGTLGYTWMSMNLGAKGFEDSFASPGQALNSYGLYYQWGRKDPFIGPKAYNDGTTITNVFYGSNFRFKYDDGNRTILNSIQNPCHFYANGEANIPADAWGSGGVKSIYDPCPEGWRVPYYQNGVFPWNGLGEPMVQGLIGVYKISDNYYLPAQGYYNYNGWGSVSNIASGYYWVADEASDSKMQARNLYFMGNGTNLPDYISYKNLAMPIRCVKDE